MLLCIVAYREAVSLRCCVEKMVSSTVCAKSFSLAFDRVDFSGTSFSSGTLLVRE